MSDENVLKVERDDGVVTLTINRPRRRNALSRKLVYTLWEQIEELEHDRGARVIIITGVGEKAFCAGADLKERRGMSESDVRRFVPDLQACFTDIERLPKPTIAAINGAALGGGLELALACDLRVAAEAAAMGLPETRLAIIPGAGGTQRLPRLIGPSRAKELIFTGRRIDAAEALELDLVNDVTADPAQALAQARQLAGEMLKAGPIALAQAKFAIDSGLDVGLRAGLAIEQKAYEMTIPTEDRVEALAAFREKREPNFKGK